MRVEFYGLRFDLPDSWEDITDDLPDGSPPSLARPNGAGVVQFSIGKYRGGEAPNVTTADLRNLLEEFCIDNGMNCSEIMDCPEALPSVKAISAAEGGFIVARYFSNRKDVLLATYTCLDMSNSELAADLEGCEQIMNSMEL